MENFLPTSVGNMKFSHTTLNNPKRENEFYTILLLPFCQERHVKRKESAKANKNQKFIPKTSVSIADPFEQARHILLDILCVYHFYSGISCSERRTYTNIKREKTC